MKDGITIKGKINNDKTSQSQMEKLNQLHSNHMRLGMTRLLAYKCAYYVNINPDIEYSVRHSLICVEYQNTQL